jgi:hypothetical protein
MVIAISWVVFASQFHFAALSPQKLQHRPRLDARISILRPEQPSQAHLSSTPAIPMTQLNCPAYDDTTLQHTKV